jgi:hypothetical protein
MVLVAWAMLPCAEEKGRTKLQENIEHDHQGVSKASGGYLWYFMIYDCVCFLLCFAALVVLTLMGVSGHQGEIGEGHWEYDDWMRKQIAFCVQVVYGYLSLPFFVFNIPLFINVLTHAVPTAYDREGRCRKYVGPPPPPKNTLYLPKTIKGVPVLVKVEEEENKWRADKSKLKNPPSELSFCQAMHASSVADVKGLQWDEDIEGEDMGPKWIRCQVSSGMALMSEAVAEELLARTKALLTGGHLDMNDGTLFKVLQKGREKIGLGGKDHDNTRQGAADAQPARDLASI